MRFRFSGRPDADCGARDPLRKDPRANISTGSDVLRDGVSNVTIGNHGTDTCPLRMPAAYCGSVLAYGSDWPTSWPTCLLTCLTKAISKMRDAPLRSEWLESGYRARATRITTS